LLLGLCVRFNPSRKSPWWYCNFSQL